MKKLSKLAIIISIIATMSACGQTETTHNNSSNIESSITITDSYFEDNDITTSDFIEDSIIPDDVISDDLTTTEETEGTVTSMSNKSKSTTTKKSVENTTTDTQESIYTDNESTTTTRNGNVVTTSRNSTTTNGTTSSRTSNTTTTSRRPGSTTTTTSRRPSTTTTTSTSRRPDSTTTTTTSRRPGTTTTTTTRRPGSSTTTTTRKPTTTTTTQQKHWEDIIETVYHPAEYGTKTIWMKSNFFDTILWYNPGNSSWFVDSDAVFIPSNYQRDSRLTNVARAIPYASFAEIQYMATGRWNVMRVLNYNDAMRVSPYIDEYTIFINPSVASRRVNKDIDEFWIIDESLYVDNWVYNVFGPYYPGHSVYWDTWWPWLEETVCTREAWTEDVVVGRRCIETGEVEYY